MAEWNYEVNPDPSTIGATSGKPVLWTCMYCGDSWEAKPACRNNPGCHKCCHERAMARRRKPGPGQSLKEQYRDIADEWDDDLNDCSASDVYAHARYHAHFICSVCGFRYQAWVYNRTTQGSGCPECKKRLIAEKNSTPKKGRSVAEMSKKLTNEWHPTLNGTIKPSDVCAMSGKKYWWLGECGHEWLADPAHRMAGTGCPICNGRVVLPGFNDLETVAPDIARQWDGDASRGYTPKTISYGSSKKLGFICPDCNRQYEMKICNRTIRGHNCSHCHADASTINIVKSAKDRTKTHDQFVKEASVSAPNLIIVGTYIDAKHKILVKCKKCGQYSLKFPGGVLNNIAGGCKNCGVLSLRIPEDDFKSRISTSSPNTRLISPYTKASDKMEFECSKCGCRWMTTGQAILQGSGCPDCHHYGSFPESAIYYYVKKHFPDADHNVKGLLSSAPTMELDVLIPSIRKAIEYDGERWHFNIDRDVRKDAACLAEDIELIRVREPKCPAYRSPGVRFIDRRTSHGYASLNDSIIEIMEYLDIHDVDVDTRRDMGAIKDLMPKIE